MILKPRRGDIWLVRLDPVEGSEQAGVRPFVIIQRDALNEVSPVTIGFPLTSQLNRVSSMNVLLDYFETGLHKPSFVLLNQIRSISKNRLLKKLGAVSPTSLQQIEYGFLPIMGIPLIKFKRF
ncbi:type II toxin-antitoxin system PemK/MazF family toxin [Candidatus Woesearchaeota archaeon]|nr:type II toxin-antitoxin system PemK/MazF family toxin [Candidatus Woesearchaeota archaeon]